MKQIPNNITYKKPHLKTSFKGLKGTKLALYTTGLKTRSNAYLEYKHFETLRRFIVRKLRTRSVKNKRNLKYLRSIAKKRKSLHKKKTYKYLFLRPHFHQPRTKKPLQVRMGKGKGSPYKYVYPNRKSRFIVEFSRRQRSIGRIRRLLIKSRRKFNTKLKFCFDLKYLRREHYSGPRKKPI
jgi:ribosomal protein L16/L10AE